MPEQQQKKTLYKRGELNIGQVLLEQVLGTLKELREQNYEGFINGVEGFYLILFPKTLTNQAFLEEDRNMFEDLTKSQLEITNDIRLWPEDRTLMFSDLGLQIAKRRLANLIVLADKNRLWFEMRRIYDERKPGESETGEPTEEELAGIIDAGPEEEQD